VIWRDWIVSGEQPPPCYTKDTPSVKVALQAS
jgi:hypothetical protein